MFIHIIQRTIVPGQNETETFINHLLQSIVLICELTTLLTREHFSRMHTTCLPTVHAFDGHQMSVSVGGPCTVRSNEQVFSDDHRCH